MSKRIHSLAAFAALMVAASAAFPVTLTMENSVWRDLVEPESGTFVPGCKEGVPGSASVVVRDEAQLARIFSNIEQLNFINGFVEGEGLSLAFPEQADEDAEAAARVLAEAAAADAAAAAAQAQATADAAAAAEAAAKAAAEAAAKTTKPTGGRR
jgi:hypothetical protein